eukprot:1660336-Pleurochrysis_carterae.AAC.1
MTPACQSPNASLSSGKEDEADRDAKVVAAAAAEKTREEWIRKPSASVSEIGWPVRSGVGACSPPRRPMRRGS